MRGLGDKERLIIQAIQMTLSPSRADIASLTGLSLSRISVAVRSLIQQDLLFESKTNASPSSSGRGQTRLSLPRSAGLVGGLSLDLDYASACLADLNGEIVCMVSEAKTINVGYEEMLHRVIELLEKVCWESDVDTSELLSIGVVLPNRIEMMADTKQKRTATTITSTPAHESARSALELKFGVPCLMESRIKALAASQYFLGSARDLFPFIYLDLDRSVGAALCLNADGVSGFRSRTAELAHINVRRAGEQCYCGNRGCLETVSSVAAIQDMAEQRAQIVGESFKSNLSLLRAAALGGEGWASRLFSEVANGLATALAKIVYLADPKAIIFGGALSNECLALFLPEVKAKLKQKCYRFSSEIQLLPAEKDTENAALGIARLAAFVGIENAMGPQEKNRRARFKSRA